ncbi:LysM peptidoglycan-binding domain-containing protein [Companilactobacillus metriopterae]|uniref:LysM peptidoglycan-binding domain-containing protein n=1 Tax=Companilactobacillus metriopterae TaxID=1909267 RepID=UPI00100ADDA3
MKKTLLTTTIVAAFGIFSASTANTAQAAVANGNGTVTVEAGDTYKSIAANNNMTIAQLEQTNGREVGGFDLIFPGEVVYLQNTSSQSAQTQSTASTTNSTATVSNESYTPQVTTTSAATSAGSFKISFYDPAVLGSSMGYNGVAANLSVFPRGTQLKITLSNGTVLYRIVNDTGSFAYSNPYQLDVAMPSSQIPGYGVTTASVQVIG